MKQVELDRMVRAELKNEARNRGWKTISNQAYWKVNELFFQLLVSTSAREQVFQYFLRVKWSRLDDQLWKVLGMMSNASEPISLRANGAYTLFGHDVLSDRVTDCEWTTEWLRQNLNPAASRAQKKAAEIASAINNIDDYLAFIELDYQALLERRPDTTYNTWKEQVLAALEKGDVHSAKEIASARVVANDSGGFVVGGHSFYQCVLECLNP
jgi:hypothetical protein